MLPNQDAAKAPHAFHPIYYQHTGPELRREFESIAALLAQGKTLDEMQDLSREAIRHAVEEFNDLYHAKPGPEQQFFAVVPEEEIAIIIDAERKTIVAHRHATVTQKGTLKLSQGFRAGACAIDNVLDVKMIYINAEHAVDKLNSLLGELAKYN